MQFEIITQPSEKGFTATINPSTYDGDEAPNLSKEADTRRLAYNNLKAELENQGHEVMN